MTESKFTPGPWRTVIDGTMTGRSISIVADDWTFDDGSPHVVAETDLVQVNRVRNHHENGWEDTGEADMIRADARLIAAAPDLLKAAQEAIAVLNTNAVETTITREAKRFLRAAIRKAVGR